MWWTSLLQQVTKFRSSYSFGYLLRILLRAVNLFSFSHTVSSDSSFNIRNYGSEVEEKSFFFYFMSEDEAQHNIYTFWVIVSLKMLDFICPFFTFSTFFGLLVLFLAFLGLNGYFCNFTFFRLHLHHLYNSRICRM